MIEEKILTQVEKISEKMIAEIIQIVQINSIQSEQELEAPYGQGVKQALVHSLALSEKLGFKTKNLENQIGYAYYGEQEEYVCAIGHLDVVPVGLGWEHPPFSGRVEDEKIISRGVLDNKGPIYACLFAMHALKELDIACKRQVRIIFGCNEESGFHDLKYYLVREEVPVAGFTPDCKYPVVYAERGRASVLVTSEETQALLNFVNTKILNQNNDGKMLGIAYQNEEFGKLETRNYQFVNANRFTFDISYPAGITIESIVDQLETTEADVSVEIAQNFDPVFFDKDCRMVQIMQEAYEKVTELDGTPVPTTGGTYAKLMPNIVPFGPSFPGQKGIGHKSNEWMKIEDIITNAKIYALALYHLACEDRL